MRSATFQLGLVPFGCNRLIVTYWISLPPRVRRASFRHSPSSHSPLLGGICFNFVFCVIASSLCPDLANRGGLPARFRITRTGSKLQREKIRGGWPPLK